MENWLSVQGSPNNRIFHWLEH